MESMPTFKFLAVLNPEENTNVDVLLKLIDIDSERKRVSVVIKNEDISFL
tara:strand:- start:239 stop:388 length:150 start_codon:yes stop_codon:yes gene_type:complete